MSVAQKSGAAACIGLTGLIGSGKSHVREMLAALGAVTLDADKVAHAVYDPGQPAVLEIERTFGPSVITPEGTVDRGVLGELVFTHPDAGANMKKLTDIVWPATNALLVQQFSTAADSARKAPAPLAGFPPSTPPTSAMTDSQLHALLPPSAVSALTGSPDALGPRDSPLLVGGRPILVLEAAVLLQAGWQHQVDTVWATTVPEETAVKRIMERNALQRGEAEARVASQVHTLAASGGDVDTWIHTDASKTHTRHTVARLWVDYVRGLQQAGATGGGGSEQR